MNHNLKQRIVQALRLTPIFVFPLLVIMPSPKTVAVVGDCSYFGSTPIIGTPHSSTCMKLEGYGLYIDWINANFSSASRNVCNWRYDLVFTRLDGTHYATRKGPTESGCHHYGSTDFNYGKDGNTHSRSIEGKVCAVLYASGIELDRSCLHISP